ncbi:MAG: aminopeptidase P N-terminal domain-containing protein [Alphaproteobacteria bacterium]|nr:aminopeptidase P N-terminal domain-containing protein [Alphaproteobacteria bacterium]
MLAKPDFQAHRSRLQGALREGEAVLLFGGPHHLRNGDAEYRYRPDSDVYWLTGWPDPHVAVFVTRDAITMFVEPKDREREVWTGFRPGPDGAKAHYGADEAFEWGEIEEKLTGLLSGIDTLHHAFAVDAEHDALLMSCIAKARRKNRRDGLSVPETFCSLDKLVHELRLIKGPDELEVMREAGRVSAEAHVAAMRVAAAGMPEYRVEAELLRVFHEQGSTGPGYTSIVAGGANATVLHYITNRNTLKDGELLLIDAGCEISHYTADITRTFPIGGRFTPAQRAMYDVVLKAQLKAIDTCRAGKTFNDVHDVAVRVLTEGMVKLGLLVGDVDELIADESYKKYYMHGTSHWLGLDVHDVGAYGRDGQVRVLAPDMVLTVEPGLYVAIDDADAPEAYRGIGIRIEDDVRVTDGDPEILTAGVPKHPDDLADLLASPQS